MTHPAPQPDVMTLEETEMNLRMAISSAYVAIAFSSDPADVKCAELEHAMLVSALHHLEAGKRGVLKKISELTPEDSALQIFCLPLGMVLVGPSESERVIIELYARHRQQTQDPRMIGVTSSPQPSQQEAASKCMKCGGSHAFDTSVDSRQWNEVIRACGLPDFLCLMCIVEAFAGAGKSFEARLYGDAFHGDTISFSPQPSQQEAS